MAGFLGGLVATMLDPLVAAAGIAAYFIGRARGSIALGLGVFAFAFALYIFTKAAAQSMHADIGGEKFGLLLIAVALWTLMSAGVGLLSARIRSEGE